MTAQKHHAGFTLLELLVVVAIIAVLAGMLLPAVNMVRNNAKQTICMNNQRMMPMACVTYSNDWEGYLPYSSTLDGTPWNVTLNDYLETGGRVNTASTAKASKVFMCPMDPRPYSATLTSAPRSYSFVNLDESDPAAPSGWSRGEDGTGKSSFHLSKFVHMSTTVLIGERASSTSTTLLTNWQWGGAWGWG